MTALFRRVLFASRPHILLALPILAFGTLFLAKPPDGQERSSWLLFVGNFHVLTIHFPIVLLYLIPILEVVGRHRRLPHLKASVEFVLFLAILASIFAALLGWCLARNGGYSGKIVSQHMWGGILVAAASWVCWMLRAHVDRPRIGLIYALVLAATVGLVSWTGYRGGQLTQGEDHLKEGMPTGLKNLLHISMTSSEKTTKPPDPKTFFGARIEPVLAVNCFSCHGSKKQRGQLRLDSYASLVKGGKHGKIIKSGASKTSEIIRRITLPQSDDNAMPPQGKRPLTAAEIKTLELWIDAGASETLAVEAVTGAPAEIPQVAEITFQELDPSTIQRQRASTSTLVEELRKRYPNVVDYEARNSAKISLNASLLGSAFGDQDMLVMKPILESITSANLSGTNISDRSADLIGAMLHVRTLQLSHTKITDTTVKKLEGLKDLESLNLLGTSLALSSSLLSLSESPKLRHIYVADTRIAATNLPNAHLKNQLVF